MQTHAYLCGTVILMWFYLHATNSFVFIIITRLEEADLFGLVATVMPLCLSIKNNFTTWTFVMSRHHRTRNIRREIVPHTFIKLHFQYFQEEGWKFDWWWSCLLSCSVGKVFMERFLSAFCLMRNLCDKMLMLRANHILQTATELLSNDKHVIAIQFVCKTWKWKHFFKTHFFLGHQREKTASTTGLVEAWQSRR